jgi:hypothetical protein
MFGELPCKPVAGQGTRLLLLLLCVVSGQACCSLFVALLALVRGAAKKFHKTGQQASVQYCAMC